MEATKWIESLDREDIVSYLPYFDYDDGIFVLSDGGFGIAVECIPSVFATHDLQTSLESLLTTIPENVSIQFILSSLHDVEGIIDEWKYNKVEREGLFGEVIENYQNFIEGKKFKKIGKFFNTPVRNYRLVVTLKLGGKEKEFSALDFLKNPAKFFWGEEDKEKEEIERKIKELKEIRDKFIGGLKGAFGYAEPLNADGLIRFVYTILNQNHDIRDVPKWDGASIRDLCVNNDTVIEVQDKYISVDGIYGKSLNVKEYPDYWSLADAMNYIGDIFGNRNLEEPFLIVLNAIKLDDSGKGTVRKSASVVMSQKLPESLFPRLSFKQKDLKYGMEKIEKGVDLFQVNLSIFLFSKDLDNLFANTGRFLSYFKGIGFRLEEDSYINLPVLLSMLPFGYDKTVKNFLRRGRVVFLDNVVSLAPSTADWRGHPSPELLFFSPRGQLTGFNFFNSSQGGYNATVIGTTGAGKSVLLQYIALSYRLAGDRVWIVDIGRSYEQLAKMFDGEFIEFHENSPICLNPFSTIENEKMFKEYKDFLKDFFCMLGLPKNVELAEQQVKLIKSHLSKALSLSWERYGNKSSVDTVLDALSELTKDTRVLDFIQTAEIYRTDGEYGPFFNGEANVSFNKSIIVLENDALENKPDLRNPVMMLLNFHISKEIYLNQDRTNRNIVIIDEAHKFIGEPTMEMFIEQAYRRFRKHGASMILGTQGFDDFFGPTGVSKAGRVVIDNSKYTFFMLQQDISRLKTKQYFQLKDENIITQIFDSVSQGQGEYSEFFIYSSEIKTKLRLVLDDFLKTLFFTDKDVRDEIRNLVNQGYSWGEAIKIVEKKRGS